MSKSTRSSELLNVDGKKKNAIENLLKSTDENKTEKPSLFPPGSNSQLPLNSDILSRVQAFLPQIKSANEKLEKEDPNKLDIENVNEDGQYIEMNLGLGVYDVKKPGETDSESEDDDDDSEKEDLIIPNNNNSNSKKPIIEMMDE